MQYSFIEIIGAIILAIIGIFIFYIVLQERAECTVTGGVYLKGAFNFECVHFNQ